MDKNEAIEVLKKYQYDPEVREALECLHPELKESEDERIRKGLINYFNDFSLPTFGGLDPKKIIAWLEKQGQHKPVISDEAIREGVAHFGITQYQISNWLKKYIDIEKQGSQNLANSAKTCKVEQKPAWSEEDEKMYTATIFALAGFMGNGDKLEWLKSLKDRYTWKPSEEQMEALDDFIYAKYPNIEKHGAAVKSLYNDLKGLSKI